MKDKTKAFALASMMAALGTVFLCLAGMIPFALYACPLLASLCLLPLRESKNQSLSWLCYGTIAILGILLGPDKEASFLFLFLGYYPLVQYKIDTISPKMLRVGTKFCLCTVSIGSMYALLLWVFQLNSLVEEVSQTTPVILLVTVLLGYVTFFLYDILLYRFTGIYLRYVKKHS